MYIYMCLVIIILLSLIYLIVAKGIKNKKRIVLISTIVIILIGFMSVTFIKFSNNEEYIKINENNKEVSIKLKNHKEYYGHKFYRFRKYMTYLFISPSETEVIKELRSNHYNAYYDQETGKVRITYDNDIFEIQMEKKENLLFINRYNYIFFHAIIVRRYFRYWVI